MPRLLKSAYRREPISSFIVTAGAVSAVIGSVDQQWSLTAVGISLIGVAIALRWWQLQQRRPLQTPQPNAAPVYYLTSRSSHSPLPPLQKPGDR